ncbi:MAG: AtpZ/AtpI family protein [Gemmatimonadetes bacterium]|nr:AtpZ/AtpI family protein [Gemmatimonadota bacterium]MBT8404184.1 AtpZ/AtpI family protein [Gemmatimonadota bacterium]NNF38847.1 AtpZ/AtpI family protein [Gemmatimonadota bacterium]NNK64143.1 AtpZ/AtpI family protein [Gemmatimonadota bacterium]
MTHPGSKRRARRGSDQSDIQRASGDALGHGFTIAAAIGLFLWAGDRADRALGSSPFLALTGMLVGAAAGFYRLYAHLTALQDASSKDVDVEEGDE